MPAKTDPRDVTGAPGYYYRRKLSVRDVLPAIGAGVAVGVATFYIVRIMLQREPLVPPGGRGSRRRRGRSTRVHGG